MYRYDLLQEAEFFVLLINRILEHFGFTEYLQSIAMFRALSDSYPLSATLNEIQSAKVNIIFGFFGPEKARHILCMVSFSSIVRGRGGGEVHGGSIAPSNLVSAPILS